MVLQFSCAQSMKKKPFHCFVQTTPNNQLMTNDTKPVFPNGALPKDLIVTNNQAAIKVVEGNIFSVSIT